MDGNKANTVTSVSCCYLEEYKLGIIISQERCGVCLCFLNSALYILMERSLKSVVKSL